MAQTQTNIDVTDPLGSGWMIIAAAMFALMGALVKHTSSEFQFGANELVFWRTLFSVLVLGSISLVKREQFATPYFKEHISRGIAGTLGMVLFFYGITHLPLATAVTLNYTSPIFLALLSFFVLKEKISLYTQAMLVLGFMGIVVLLRPTFAAGQEIDGLISLSAGLCAGWAYLKVRELSLLGEPGWRVVLYFSVVATIMTAILATFDGWTPVTLSSLPYLLALGLTAMIGQLNLTRAYKVGQKFTVASLSYLTVVFSTLAGVLWLGDVINWQEILGMSIIMVSGILSSLYGNK